MSFALIDTAPALAALVAKLAGVDRIAVDTEGNSFHAYRDRVCLIQIGFGGATAEPQEAEPAQIHLIDPLSVDVAPLGPLFADPAHLLVVHGGDFDVRSLRRDFGFSFGRMFDTMLAAQTLRLPELGLAALLRTELGQTIAKGEQRSDWGRRPLRREQLSYAAADVEHLLSLAARLAQKLADAGKVAAAEEQFEKLRHLVAREKTFDPHGFTRIRAARGLDETQRSVLKALWAARERVSKELDRAPFKVIGEPIMVDVAKAMPESLDALRRVRGVGDLAVRKLGDGILAAVREAKVKRG